MMLLVLRLLLIKVVVAMRVKVVLRGWLVLHKPESIVIMYLISIMMHTAWKQICTTFTIFYVFLVYKIKAYARIEHLERNYLISNWTKKLSIEEFVSYPMKRHFVYTEEEVLIPMMRLILERSGKQIHVKRNL